MSHAPLYSQCALRAIVEHNSQAAQWTRICGDVEDQRARIDAIGGIYYGRQATRSYGDR
jgi:hypothetical protein